MRKNSQIFRLFRLFRTFRIKKTSIVELEDGLLLAAVLIYSAFTFDREFVILVLVCP